MTKEEQQTMRDILNIEWEMFHSVQGIDGPAPCQQDRKTFEIMRSSQILSWNEETAESYLEDLRQAKAKGRNLMTEKYARMMEYTSPCEFRRIAPSLSRLDKPAAPLIERLSRLSVEWMEELAAKYPHVAAQGRPIHAWADSKFTPSFETYNRAELATYSVRTLQLLEDHYRTIAAEGKNPAEEVLRHTVARYGYASLEQAEAAQKARRAGEAAGDAANGV
jgi:Protein of unknown function (DUF4125)